MEIKKYFIIIFMLMAMFAGSCSDSHLSLDKKIKTTVAKKMEDVQVEDTSVPEFMISQKIVWLVAPLGLALFISIPMIFLGARLVGLGVLVSSITCLILVITMAVMMKYVAMIGLIVLIVGLFFFFREIYLISKNKREMYKSVDIAKKLVPQELRGILRHDLNELQSKATKKIVKKFKGE